ncbi:threonine/serine exporter family protein [Romboutsia sedimentorum]|uniref:Threonine/serine exporter family protein n=1 Tax=Romboutsia sedimentorum TaxID=1368474 RepID=A0ABT7ECJ2_9FIRM|nr:threonine/serine exporter family protein [Romboutsia sedimentorum]MDK2564659.1 threonine/serine exporter family protein [Romboutsia sedimentorum]MDK2586366.1 threonine/serine exporter family protein [Romboutsia sedimentorum]
MNSEYKKDVLRLALFIGELMLTNGAETYRVEDSVLRICRSRGFNHVSAFTAPTVIIISDERFDGLSFMKTIKSRSINLNKISLLNNFSREFVNNPDLSIEDAIEELKQLGSVPSYPNYLVNISTGFASAFFGCLLGGDNLVNFFFTFLTSILAIICYKKIMKVSSIPTFSSLVASVLIATAGVLLAEFGILDTPRMLIVGSIMPLLPGVSFIKGIRDLISGDLISGVSRAFDAGMTAISIACGVGLILDMWVRLGGKF